VSGEACSGEDGRAEKDVIDKLSDRIRSLSELGWTIVDDHLDEFKHHG
jgi:hypothetical protein